MTLQLTWQNEENLSLAGDLCFHSVAGLSKNLASLSKDKQKLMVNLNAIAHSDSAGLAIILAWVQLAKQNKFILSFMHMPQQIIKMAEITGVLAVIKPHVLQ
jgi:phospholipid transport system transporter-binding protein